MGGLSSDYRRELEEKAKRMAEKIDAKRAVSRQGGVMSDFNQWAVLPKTLTNEMVRAFVIASTSECEWDESPEKQKLEAARNLQSAYEAMIAAAPQETADTLRPRDARVEAPKDVIIRSEYNPHNKSHYRIILEYDDRDDAYECWHWLREWRYAMQGDIDKGSGPC